MCNKIVSVENALNDILGAKRKGKGPDAYVSARAVIGLNSQEPDGHTGRGEEGSATSFTF